MGSSPLFCSLMLWKVLSVLFVLAVGAASQACPDSVLSCSPTLFKDELWIPLTTYNTSDCSNTPMLESWIRNDSCVHGGYTTNLYYNYIASGNGDGVERLNCKFDVNRFDYTQGGYLDGCYDCTSSVPRTIYSFGTCVDGVVVGAPSRPPTQSEWTTSRSSLNTRVDMGTGCIIGNPGNTPTGFPTRNFACSNGTLTYRSCRDLLCNDCSVIDVSSTCCRSDGPPENRWQVSCQEFLRLSYPRLSPPPPDEESHGNGLVPSFVFIFAAVFIAALGQK